VPSEKRNRQRERRNEKLAAELVRTKRNKRTRTLIGAVVVAGLVVGVIQLTSKSPPKPIVKSDTLVTVSTKVPPVCPPVGGTKKRYIAFTKAPPTCIDATGVYDAKVVTDIGDFTIQLNAKDGVAGVNSFVFLARNHYYDTTKFHRVIQGFVVQGGDPAGTGSGANPYYSFTGSTPAASCVKKNDCYASGEVALANTGKPSSDGGQFFIILPNGASQLTDNYTVIGKVVSGMTVVDAIGNDGSPATSETGTPTIVHRMKSVTITQVSA
jgi:cyclophilin family peptidyl-prolyl cis-trans isomerase